MAIIYIAGSGRVLSGTHRDGITTKPTRAERNKQTMKIHRLTNEPYKTTTIILDGIYSKFDKNGKEHIYIKSADGRYFSNFKGTWDKQNLPVESLEKGDKLEVTYVTKAYNGKDYNNYIKVKFVERPALVAKLSKLPDNGATDDAEKLLAEIDL